METEIGIRGIGCGGVLFEEEDVCSDCEDGDKWSWVFCLRAGEIGGVSKKEEVVDVCSDCEDDNE